VNPKPMSATPVRTHAMSVRSRAMRVRIQPKWLSDVVRTSNRPAGSWVVLISRTLDICSNQNFQTKQHRAAERRAITGIVLEGDRAPPQRYAIASIASAPRPIDSQYCASAAESCDVPRIC
jgi:hypothetical protein